VPFPSGVSRPRNLPVIGLVGEQEYLRMVREPVVFERVVDLPAKVTREPDLLLRSDLLASDQEDLMVEPRSPDIGDHMIIERPAEVKARYLRSEPVG
jgi:hypothetical protein